jgi:hypothetical protein
MGGFSWPHRGHSGPRTRTAIQTKQRADGGTNKLKNFIGGNAAADGDDRLATYWLGVQAGDVENITWK